MQLVIATTANTAETTAATEIKWIAKGGSSINSLDGRWALRKNSKGTWKVVENGTTVASELTKDEAKAYAEAVVAPATDVKAALLAGEAKVYSVRGNGTLRRRHFLTGMELDIALAIQYEREQGLGLAYIAKERHVSISHIRRVLIDLALTEELTALGEAELAAMLQGAAE